MLRSSLSSRHGAARCCFQLAVSGQRRCLLTLAIETSCDDTCVAVLEYKSKGVQLFQDEKAAPRARLHFHEKVTAPNTGKGGIHPREAAESHRASLGLLIEKALKRTFLPAGKTPGSVLRPFISRPDFISVTRGPGMIGSLTCGLDTAKGLALAFGVPLVGVHHMQAHTLTPRLVRALRPPTPEEAEGVIEPAPAFPFLTLLVSGGHTMLLHSRSLTEHKILANTMDIAVGDALDKCGRLILPQATKEATPDTAYGRYMSAYAFPEESDFSSYPVSANRTEEIEKPVNQYGWRVQLPLRDTRKLAFSYAGFESSVEKIISNKPDISDAERILLARTVLGAAFEHLCSRVVMVLQDLQEQDTQLPPLVISGGVSANKFLRYYLRQMLNARGFSHLELIFPPVSLVVRSANPKMLRFEPCTDNAVMIAWAGMEMYIAGWQNRMSIDAIPRWSMDHSINGGIIGVEGCYNRVETLEPRWDWLRPKRHLEFVEEQVRLKKENSRDNFAKEAQIVCLWKMKKRIDKEDAEARAIEKKRRKEGNPSRSQEKSAVKALYYDHKSRSYFEGGAPRKKKSSAPPETLSLADKSLETLKLRSSSSTMKQVEERNIGEEHRRVIESLQRQSARVPAAQ